MDQDSKDEKSSQIAGKLKNPVSDNSVEVGIGVCDLMLKTDAYKPSRDTSLFSSSLPVLPHDKTNFNDSENSGQSLDENSPNFIALFPEHEFKDPFEGITANAIGDLLPDDEEELLAGIMDDFDLTGLPSQVEDLEDYDLFGSGGGMEMDGEPQENLHIGLSKLHLSDGFSANGFGHYGVPNGVGTVAGEHPYGEHPSRTLFVRNINSNVEDSELRFLFEQYGDIRTLYTACKHRGFVMISYYDIRDARAAMRALQNKPLRRRKLDIHFSIPKDNPSEKDINQGTLVVFNLDASVSNDDLRQLFGAYGEVKEIRETPNKRHHKFIEYYDVRAAEAALKALNRIDIAGKRIKLEPSRPGGARRNLMQQLSQELELDDSRPFRPPVGSPIANSPPGNWGHLCSPAENNSLHGFVRSPGVGAFSPMNGSKLSGLASILSPRSPNYPKIAPIGKDQGRVNSSNQVHDSGLSVNGSAFSHPHSFPDQKLSLSPVSMSRLGESNPASSGIGTLSGPQFLWGSPTAYNKQGSSSVWSTSSSGHTFQSNRQDMGFPHASRHGSFLRSHSHHHVGSAPSDIPLNRHFGFFPESQETLSMSSVGFGGGSFNRNPGSYLMDVNSRVAMNSAIGLPGTIAGNGSPSFHMMSVQRHGPMFIGNGLFAERGPSRRVENIINQMDCKQQFQLDLDKIISGEDSRTTLMIKNIPNKYTSKLLLAAIDESHLGTYDFLYLPIDFKNKCNVGYAFINMVSPSHIISFYEAFNGKKWEKFNSEKVASLAYARIQGKAALVAHFQNSSLMNEDKRCRPILFHSEGEEAENQEYLLSGNLNIFIRQPDGSYVGDPLDSPEGSLDEI